MTQDELCELVNNLRQLPKENGWVEFKVNNSDPYGIGASLSALANGANLHNQPFGYLIFGIDDLDHSIVGTKFKFSQEKIGNEEVENWLLRRMDPRPNVNSFEFQHSGKDITLIQVPAAMDRPVGFHPKDSERIEYIRVGSYTKRLCEYPEKARKIWRNDLHRCFEKEISKTNLSSNDVLALLDYPKYFELTKQPLPSTKEGILERLVQEGFVVKRHISYDITNLGAVLFAKDIRQFETVSRKTLRIIFYNGKNRIETNVERQNDRGYAVDFEDAVSYICERLPSNEVIRAALRKEFRMYPSISIRELLANALIHQDFEVRGTGPTVEVFEDRLEISNPGTPLIKTDRFIDGRQSRNEQLATAMRRMHICEERGQGIDKAIFYIELFQLPAPNFEAGSAYTKATLYAQRPLDKMEKADRIRACYQHCCLKHVSGEVTTNESIRKRFNLSDNKQSFASKIINDTIEAGLIQPVDPLSNARKYAKYKPAWA